MKNFFILLYLVSFTHTKAQEENSLTNKIISFCQEITSEPPCKEKVLSYFQHITHSTIQIKKKEVYNEDGNILIEDEYNYTLPSEKLKVFLRVHKKEEQITYRLDVELHSNYDTLNEKIVYSTTTKYRISFAELSEKLGNPIYDSFIQPKDTKHSSYIYINSKTNRRAKISIVSYNPPNAHYNTIYKISIFNI